MIESINYLVRVNCMTYNHAPFITDAMNGFTMQQTTFPFVCIIVDDASTDGEPEIISRYMRDNFDLADKVIAIEEETDDYRLMFARHKSNQYCYFVALLLKYNHDSINKPKHPYYMRWVGAKYIAMCEGDDFWIAKDKLQQQVDFMEVHPEHSLCFCAHKELYPDGHLTKVYRYESNIEICPMDELIYGSGGYMATCSMLYVADKSRNYPDWAKSATVGDLPLMLVLATRGKVGFLRKCMCAYRLSTAGSWSYRLARNRNMQKSHYHGSVNMWKCFDEFTNRNYHSVINALLSRMRKQYIRLTVLYYIKYQFK